MIRAAIIGLGRWGRSLVTSVQGKSDDISFVRAHTRTRASAVDFCRDKGVPLADSYEQISATLDMPVGSIGPIRARSLKRLQCHHELREFAAAS